MQFKGTLINQTWKDDKKPNLGPDFGPNLVPQIFFVVFFFYYILYIVTSYHGMQFQEKLMNQTWENDKKILQSFS